MREARERFPSPYKKVLPTKEHGVRQINEWREAESGVALTFGAFDLPHYKHAEYLHAIANLPGVDKVAVGLDTDELFASIKDRRGPIISWHQRAQHITHYPYVDVIFPHDSVEPEWMEGVRPSHVVFSTTSSPGWRAKIDRMLPYFEQIGSSVVLLDENYNIVPSLDEFERKSIEFARHNEEMSGTRIRREIGRRTLEDLPPKQ